MKKLGLLMCLLALIPNMYARDFKSLDVDEFAKEIKSHDVVLVDVRNASEYETGHIGKAVNYALGIVLTEAVEKKKLSKLKTIAVYCRSGNRSKKAAAFLADNGYRVIELDKGILAWEKAGKPIKK